MQRLADATYEVRLGFAPEEVAVPDPDHPGLRRAGPRASAPYGSEHVAFHRCPAVDCTDPAVVQPDLAGFGFDTVDLSGLDALQRTCADIRSARHIDEEQAAAIRAALDGAELPTASGHVVQVRYIADEGFILRTGGPNGMSLVGPRSVGMNGHGSATSVHADQDVYGTPLVQLMDGRAPELFVHHSPEGANPDADLHLVNLWIPLQQITQPLVLADGRSIDRRRHQLRFGLPTGSFLERGEDMVINDIWTFLHDDDQAWYFRSEMDHRCGYVFNTLSTPHGAGTLPGEDVAERCYLALESAEAAASGGDVDALVGALAGLGQPDLATATPALRSAVQAMLAVVDRAIDDPAAACGGGAADWVAASQEARGAVVRMSLEMRMVVSVEG